MKSEVALLLTACLSPWGCTHTVQAGLSNAPAPGSATTDDPRVHDVIANGSDSCGRHLDPGPLRYRVPPCPRPVRPAPEAALAAPLPPAAAHSVVFPWLEHYHARWPCDSVPGIDGADDGMLALSRPPLSQASCGIR